MKYVLWLQKHTKPLSFIILFDVVKVRVVQKAVAHTRRHTVLFTSYFFCSHFTHKRRNGRARSLTEMATQHQDELDWYTLLNVESGVVTGDHQHEIVEVVCSDMNIDLPEEVVEVLSDKEHEEIVEVYSDAEVLPETAAETPPPTDVEQTSIAADVVIMADQTETIADEGLKKSRRLLLSTVSEEDSRATKRPRTMCSFFFFPSSVTSQCVVS